MIFMTCGSRLLLLSIEGTKIVTWGTTKESPRDNKPRIAMAIGAFKILIRQSLKVDADQLLGLIAGVAVRI